MKQMFFVPTITWEHLASEVICKELKVSLDMPNKILARFWVLQKGKNPSNKQAVIYLFILFYIYFKESILTLGLIALYHVFFAG